MTALFSPIYFFMLLEKILGISDIFTYIIYVKQILSGHFFGIHMEKQGITPEFLEELKYKTDIVQTISQYVPLQKKGGRYFGCCPFHNEKTPSFCVNRQSAFYHCFGCGASGDVIKFIMEIESMSFVDAVRYLSEKAGIPMPELRLDVNYEQKKEHKDVLKQIMREAARYYRNNLLDEVKGKEARDYLAGRGIDDETSLRYGLGLSLGYEGLPNYLRLKGHSPNDLVECGLIGSASRPSDAFANRIIVPIINSMNEVIAFGGRIYHGEQDVAKYKNSTNTTLFDKGRTIYGINRIKADKRKGGSYTALILVEGYMDVISLGAHGINNAVACMGTALTDGQARELRRMTQDIYVCYDGDGAGRKATVKNVDPLVAAGLNVRVVCLDNGLDPDETVRASGKEGFEAKLASALSVTEYKLKLCEDAYDLSTVDGRAKYLIPAVNVLKAIDDAAQREVYAAIVAEKGKISIETVLRRAADRQSDALERSRAAAEVATDKCSTLLRASRFVISRIMENAPYVDLKGVKKEWLINDVHRDIYDVAQKLPPFEFNVASMYTYLNNDDEQEISKVMDVNLHFADLDREEKYYNDCIVSLADNFISVELDAAKRQYGKTADAAERRALVEKIAMLQKKLKAGTIGDKM